jgi:hypothetical protein
MGLLGRSGVILVGTTVIGKVKNVTMGISAEKIKEYTWDSDKPECLVSGNKTITFSIEKLYVDSTYFSYVRNGDVLTIEVRPEGTGSGKPKATLNSSILDKCDFKAAQSALIGENVSGEAYDITFGVQVA